MNKNAHPLAAYEGILHTRVGAAFPGSRAVFRGQDLHRDLKDMDWLALCALSMNLSALLSAFAADFGWAPREFNLLMHTCFLAGMYPCYIEAADKPPGAMFPVRCTDVRYEGVARRDWPSA